jgi:hypothetical protein
MADGVNTTAARPKPAELLTPASATTHSAHQAPTPLVRSIKEYTMTNTTALNPARRRQVLPVVSLLVAGAAAAISITAITTDNTASILEPAAEADLQPTGQPTTLTTTGDRVVIHNVDGCGRPIVRGQPRCE